MAVGNSGSYNVLTVYNSDGAGGKLLKNPMLIFIRDNYLNDGSKTNLAIKKATDGRLPHEWRGNVLIVKCKNKHFDHVVDITMDDLPYIVAYMQQYGSAMQYLSY